MPAAKRFFGLGSLPSKIPQGVFENLAATSFRLGLLVLVGREVASHLGSEGIVVMGQLQNLLALGLALPLVALQTGIQQALGSAAPHQIATRSSWALLTGQSLALVSGLVLLWACNTGVVYLPQRIHHVLWMLLPGLMAMTLVGNLQAIAAGRVKIKKVNLFIALSGPAQALWLFGSIRFGLQGLAPGVLLFGLVAAPLALWLMSPFPLERPHQHQWREQFRLWAPLAAMGAVAALVTPYKLIWFRETILAQGVDTAANWQAAVRITDLLFATWATAFATWALPRLSGPSEMRPGFFKLVLGPAGALVLCLVLIWLGPLALDLAYMGRFPAALPVLRLQSAAEVLQACCLPLGLILIARRRLQIFAALEVGSAIFQIVLVRILVPQFGPYGAPLTVMIESSTYIAVAGWVVWSQRKDCPSTEILQN